MMDIRVNSLATQNIVGIPSCLPSFICWTFTHWGGCRSQSLSLRPASRCRCHGLAVFSPIAPCRPHTCPPAFGCRQLTSPASSSTFRLLSRVGEGDISALGCGLTGSCSSTFQCYSLGNHPGVTASPQFPLPAGYVTLPVDGRSPPLGLRLPHSREQASFNSSFLNAFQSYAPRTIRDEAHRM
jgi:hypothetical protein